MPSGALRVLSACCFVAGGFVQVDDILEAEGLPDPENKSKQEEGMEGMGDLGRNLEFMMMKIAQLDFFAGRECFISRSMRLSHCRSHLPIRTLPGDGCGAPAAADQRDERVEKSAHDQRAQCSSSAAFLSPGGKRVLAGH